MQENKVHSGLSLDRSSEMALVERLAFQSSNRSEYLLTWSSQLAQSSMLHVGGAAHQKAHNDSHIIIHTHTHIHTTPNSSYTIGVLKVTPKLQQYLLKIFLYLKEMWIYFLKMSISIRLPVTCKLSHHSIQPCLLLIFQKSYLFDHEARCVMLLTWDPLELEV